MQEKIVTDRVQISIWCRAIFYSDGTCTVWRGIDTIEFDPYDLVRLGYALLNHHEQKDKSEGIVPLEKDRNNGTEN
jgi:hypothetical protein